MTRRARYRPASNGPAAFASKCWDLDFTVLDRSVEEPPFEEHGQYAVVNVSGPTSQRESWCSWTTYDGIREKVAAALASSMAKVCLRIDSPGGDYAGCLELSRDLRDMAKESGKELVAFTDGMALSAGFAIACGASKIVCTESAAVGSVGCWAPLVDLTAQDAMFGAKVVIVSSGSAKADRNPHVPMTADAVQRMQETIDAQAALFVGVVAAARGIEPTKVASLEGAEVYGPGALAFGLVDEVVRSWAAFVEGKEETPMATKASKYDEALGALKRASEEDSEDGKKAKKLLKAAEEEGKPEETDDEKKDKEAKAKAAAEEKDKEEKDKEARAQALAANSLALGREVAELRAKDAARDAADAVAKEAQARASLLATRPDFSEAQRKTLAHLPLPALREAVETWPRVTALPGSAAAALTPGATPERQRPAYQPRLTAEEQEMLRKTSGQVAPSEMSAVQRGTDFQMPAHVSSELAAKRVAELEALAKEIV